MSTRPRGPTITIGCLKTIRCSLRLRQSNQNQDFAPASLVSPSINNDVRRKLLKFGFRGRWVRCKPFCRLLRVALVVPGPLWPWSWHARNSLATTNDKFNAGVELFYKPSIACQIDAKGKTFFL